MKVLGDILDPNHNRGTPQIQTILTFHFLQVHILELPVVKNGVHLLFMCYCVLNMCTPRAWATWGNAKMNMNLLHQILECLSLCSNKDNLCSLMQYVTLEQF